MIYSRSNPASRMWSVKVRELEATDKGQQVTCLGSTYIHLQVPGISNLKMFMYEYPLDFTNAVL